MFWELQLYRNSYPLEDYLMQIVLPIHNIVRWAVVILGLLALYRAYSGWFSEKKWQDADRKLVTFFTISLDAQLLLGLILYFFLSPLTKQALKDFGAAMQNSQLRFFALEHVFFMVVGIVFAHIASAVAKKDLPDKARFKRIALWLTAAVVLILIGIPWSRPLFPGL